MKLRHLALSALLAGPVLAQETTLPAESKSSHFEAVAKHLELGGVFYAYADIDADIKDLTTMIDGILSSLRESQSAPIPDKLTAAGIVNELGLNSVKALGASSRKKGTIFHNRAFLATPAGPTGLLKMFGGKPAPFTTSSLAPAGADIVVEEDINLSVVLDIVTNIIKQIGDEDVQDKFDEALKQPMGPMPFSVGEFIKKLDTKFIFFASLDSEKKLNLKNAPEPIPLINAVIALDNMAWLFDELTKLVADSDEFEVQKGDGFQAIRPTKPLPPEMDGYKPLMYLDQKTKRLYLATSPEYLSNSISGKNPLSNDEAFKKATDGLPTEGNGRQYLSANAIKQLWQVLKMATKDQPEAQVGVVMKIWEMYLPKGDSALASARANLPEGLLFTSNSTDTHKTTLMTAAVYPIAMIAGFSAPFMAQQRAAQMQQLQERNIPEEDERPSVPRRNKAEEKISPEEKISSNLEQIAFAGEAYFLDHPKDKEVTYTGLIKGGFLFEVDSVAGEDYKGLTLKRSGGKLSVKTKGGETLSHEYSAITD